jgi:hypothetical protein
MLHLHLEREREYAGMRAHAQLLVDKDEGIKAFDTYRDMLFPWRKQGESKEKQQALDILRKELAQGPLSIAPSPGAIAASKLKRQELSTEERGKLFRSRPGPAPKAAAYPNPLMPRHE